MPPRLVKITADSSVTLISADFFFFLLLFFFRSLNPDACLSTADSSQDAAGLSDKVAGRH